MCPLTVVWSAGFGVVVRARASVGTRWAAWLRAGD